MKNEKHTLPPLSTATYEEWLLDYIEGRLPVAREAELHAFLQQHPQLKEEMEGLQNVLLEAEELPAAPSWEKLKKAPEPFSELSLYDYQLVAALEGDAPVESLPLNEPATASDWQYYQLARLQSGKEEFPYKSRLHRRLLWGRPLWQSAAAAVVLLLLLFRWVPEVGRQTESPLLVQQNSPTTEATVPDPTTASPTTDVDTDVDVDADTRSNKQQKGGEQLPEKEDRTRPTQTTVDPTPYLALQDVAEKEPGRQQQRELLPLLSGPTQIQIPETELPDAYEEGLRRMLPTYIENHQLLAQAQPQMPPRQAATVSDKRLTDRAALLLRSVNPLNLEYERVFDEEGQLVAVNLGNEHFDLHQRVPGWIGSRITND